MKKTHLEKIREWMEKLQATIDAGKLPPSELITFLNKK